MSKQREIKFKGLTQDDNWIIGSLIEFKYGTYVNDEYDSSHEVKRKTVCQFTGLQDCEGKDVFEGDLLAGCNGSVNGIDWEWGESGDKVVKYIEDESKFNVPLWGTLKNKNSTHWFKVIGSIHDKQSGGAE